MENKYIFGGYIECGGKLDNGKPWHNFTVLAARPGKDGGKPLAGIIFKVAGTDENADFLADIDRTRSEGLDPCFVAYFNEKGRAVELRAAD